MNGQSLNFNSNLNILKQCISVGLLKEHDFFVCVWLCRVRHKHSPARHGECKIVLASVNWDSLASLASVKYFPNIELSLRTLNSVWAPYKVKYIESLERVQKRATKTIPELKALCYEDRLKALKLPTLAYRRVRGDMIEAYKITNGIYDTEVVPNLKFRENVSLRGHSKTLRKDRVNKRIRANSLTQRIVNIWNSLPECRLVKISSRHRDDKGLKTGSHGQNLVVKIWMCPFFGIFCVQLSILSTCIRFSSM